jgi:hypothetical protein
MMMMSSSRSLLRFAASKSRCAVAVSLPGASSSFHSSVSSSLAHKTDEKNIVKTTTPWADPAMRQYKFWNREEDAGNKGKISFLIEMSPESIVKSAKIISLSTSDDEANVSLHTGKLPLGASLLGVGTTLADFEHLRNGPSQPNVLFISPSCPRAVSVLPLVLAAFPSIEWIHCRSAGT